MISRFLTFTALVVFTAISRAETLSLLEEARDIECDVVGKSDTFNRVVVDKRDRFLTTYKAEKVVTNYDAQKFLDSAILLQAKSNPAQALLFQIFTDGRVFLTEGEKLDLKEGNCKDLGAAKECTTDKIKKLFWSPDRLTFNDTKRALDLKIDRYGYLANHATYFHAAQNASREKREAVTLIDYGAPLDLIVGRLSELKCRYLPEGARP